MDRNNRIACALPLGYAIADAQRIPGYDKDDLRQEAAVAVCEAADSYDESRGPWSDHAAAVVRRELFNLARDVKAEKRDAGDVGELSESLPDPRSPSPCDLAATGEEIGQLRAALAGLTLTQQSVLAQRFCDDPRTLAEIGLSLGCTGEAVRRVEWRAVHSLQLTFHVSPPAVSV